MANWKIQDIAPPKTAEKKVEEPPEVVPIKRVKRKKVRLPGWFTKGVLPLLILSAVLVGSVHVFFAKADVALWPEVRQVKLLEPIVAEVGREKLNKEERIIPAHTLTEEKKATRLFPASSSTIKENRASGTIRVFNAYTTTPQNLLVQTRFVSEEGKLFRTPVKITIPGKTQVQGKMVPGFVDIEVIAAEAGEEYNIEPGNFSLPGLSGSALFTVIYGESTEPMTGGSERTISVVSENDIEKAKNSLIEELTDKIVEDLLSRVPENMVATKDSVSINITEAKSLIEAGGELDQFNVSVSLIATLFMFPRADINALVDTFLIEELEEGERIFDDKTEINFQQIVLGNDVKAATLDLGVEALLYQYVDPTELKIKLRGKSKDEAENILASYSIFTQTNLALWPFWISSLPGSVDRLNIQMIID